DLDTLEPVGQIADVNARGVAVDPSSRHAFASSKPVTMWDSRTLAVIKKIDVEGSPDGILFDPFNSRVWVFSHRAPNATVIDAKDGAVAGTVDLGGEPEQAATDGAGRLFVDIGDKDCIAVVDARSLAVTARYDISGKGGGPGGLALDAKNHILFASCHNPATMVVLDADDGRILATLPIGRGADGTLTVIKENGPQDFAVEQNVKTMSGARTSTLDPGTNRVLLITAEFGPAPTQPPNGGWARRPMIPGTFSILSVGR